MIWISITCSLLLVGHIVSQVRRNIQPHWYRKHVKSRNLSTALLISSYQRCLAGGKIRKLSITLLRLQSFEGARLKAVVKTNAAWSRNQTYNMNTPYCRPGLKSHTLNQYTNIDENKSSGIIRAALFQQDWSKLPVALSCKRKNCSATVERFSV